MATAKKNPKTAAPALTGRGQAVDPLFDGAEARGLGYRWSHDESNVGTAIMGRLTHTRETHFDDGKDGLALIFSPAVILDENGQISCHRTAETLYSAGLAQKITPETDKGTVFVIRYTGTEESKKKGRNPFKTFDVAEQSPAKLVKFLRDEGEDALAALVSIGSE